MSAIKDQIATAIHWADRCKEILSKDEIAPDERVELETLCAIAIELMKSAPPSKLRDAGRILLMLVLVGFESCTALQQINKNLISFKQTDQVMNQKL